MVRHHHESWDGTGYLHGLKIQAISLHASIVAIGLYL
nr:HD domain-containing phosphohydrolase [Thermincola potens]